MNSLRFKSSPNNIFALICRICMYPPLCHTDFSQSFLPTFIYPLPILLKKVKMINSEVVTGLNFLTTDASVVTNQPHGAEPFSRSRRSLSYSRIYHHFMEPEGSLPYAQEFPIRPYPEPYECSPILSKIHFNIIIPPKPMSFSSLFPSGFPTNILYALLHACYVSCPSHPS
jgi:hypothetical protein